MERKQKLKLKETDDVSNHMNAAISEEEFVSD